ncbi:MAG: hypothetical protein IJ017_08295 [Oscillospiraceae bacterium]|nr:hypothetical protein [Oscillospiraceae bacterium]
MVLTLFKLRMREFVSNMFVSKKSGKAMGKSSKIAFAVLMVFLLVMFAGMMAGLSVSLCFAFGGTDYAWLYFALVAAMAFMLCFIGSIFAAMNYLYKAKDNELLLAMPIKPGAILLSRMLVLLVENYGFAFIVLIPAGIVWCVMQPVAFGGVVCYIIATLVLPLLALTLSCVFGWLIMLVSSKLKSTKAVTLLFAVALFGAYMWFCSSWVTFLEKLIMNGEAVAAVFEKYLFPFYHFGKASLSGDFLSLVLFLLCAAVPFAAVYFVLKTNYAQIITANRGEKKRKYRAKAMRSAGVRTALVKKEIGRYLSSPMYMLNASAGVMLMVIMGAALLINRGELLMVFEVLTGGTDFVPAAVSAALCFCVSMVVVSAPSVSVEGKNLWLLKSMPVSGFDVLDAKALCHCVVTLPFAVVSAILCAIALRANIWQSLQLFTLPAATIIFCGYLGVAVNLKFPKFDWVSEVHCVKQSASVAITMFGMMAVVIVLVVLYAAVLRFAVSADMCVLIYTVILLGLGFLLRRWLKKGGSRIFESLQG